MEQKVINLNQRRLEGFLKTKLSLNLEETAEPDTRPMTAKTSSTKNLVRILQSSGGQNNPDSWENRPFTGKSKKVSTRVSRKPFYISKGSKNSRNKKKPSAFNPSELLNQVKKASFDSKHKPFVSQIDEKHLFRLKRVRSDEAILALNADNPESDSYKCLQVLRNDRKQKLSKKRTELRSNLQFSETTHNTHTFGDEIRNLFKDFNTPKPETAPNHKKRPKLKPKTHSKKQSIDFGSDKPQRPATTNLVEMLDVKCIEQKPKPSIPKKTQRKPGCFHKVNTSIPQIVVGKPINFNQEEPKNNAGTLKGNKITECFNFGVMFTRTSQKNPNKNVVATSTLKRVIIPKINFN